MKSFFNAIYKKILYSILGLWLAIKEEKSLWAYLILLPIVIGLGVWVKLTFLEFAIVILIFFILISIEVLNTSIEATVDTISFQYNVKVKKIKDIASGATFVMVIGSIVALLLIFIPKFQEMV